MLLRKDRPISNRLSLVALATFILLSPWLALAADPPDLLSVPQTGGPGVQFAEQASPDPIIMRKRLVEVNFNLLAPKDPALAPSQAAAHQLFSFRLNLFNDVLLAGVPQRMETLASGGSAWIGSIRDVPHSQVAIVIINGMATGNIRLPGYNYQIRPAANGLHEVRQIDESAFPDLPDDSVDPHGGHSAPLLDTPPPSKVADDGTVIDVMVVYTADARIGAGGVAPMEALINLAFIETNTAYINSGIDFRLRLAHAAEVVYTETNDLYQDLPKLRLTSDGNLDDVHALRDTFSADLVSLWVETGGSACGIAYLYDASAEYGFSVVRRDCATGYFSFGHELGHNMGARHDWYMDDTVGDAPSGGSYDHAYDKPAESWRTVMAYSNRCTAVGASCTRVSYYSNPDVDYGGDPTGVAPGTDISCTEGTTTNPDCDADNRLVFNSYATTVANFRQGAVTWQGTTNSWSTGSNWSSGSVPTCAQTVVIPGTPSGGNFPTIDADGQVGSLIIENGAQVNMGDNTLDVCGNWLVQGTGTFNGTGGTVVLQGLLDQMVTMASGTNGQFANLQVGDGTQSLEVSLNSNVEIDGNLTFKTGSSLLAGTNTIKVGGNWSDEDGAAFVPGTGTVILDGSTQTLTKVSSATIFNEPFDGADAQGCCSSGDLPPGWIREHVTGYGFLGGDLGSGGVAVRWDDSDDAWLHTSGYYLLPGVPYTISYKYRNYSSSGSHDFAIWLGTSASSTNMTTSLHLVTDVSSTSFTIGTGSFTVDTAGTYYFGIRSQQNTGGNYAVVDDVILSASQDLYFYNLTVESQSSFSQDLSVQNNLTVNFGAKVNMGSNTMSVSGTTSNSGQINGTPPAADPDGIATFNGPAGLLTVQLTQTAGDLGSTEVNIMLADAFPTNGFGAGCPAVADGVQRYVNITPSSGGTGTLRFYYQDSELNTNPESSLQIYHCNGTSWSWLGSTSMDSTENYVEVTGVSIFSPFMISGALKETPANYPTSFDASTDSSSQITTSWVDSVGDPLPDGYLILCNTSGSFNGPTDGVAQSDDTNCADGSGVKNRSHGSGGSYVWSGLTPETQYYFTIYPYTNSSTYRKYKTDNPPPTANDTTLYLQDSDGNLTASGAVSEPVHLPITVDTGGEALNLFDFTLSDGATSDSRTLDISHIVINTSGNGNFNKVTWRLNGPDASQVAGVVNPGNITFSGLTISVANGDSKTYTINGYYHDTSGISEGESYVLSVDGDTDLSVQGTETLMGATSPVTNGTGSEVAIPPSISSITRVDATPTTNSSVDFLVTFNDSVAPVAVADFSLSASGASGSISGVAGSGGTRTVTVNTITGDGTLRLDLNDGNSTIVDSYGLSLTATTYSGGQTYTIDNTAPGVTITSGASNPTNSSPFQVTISFDEVVAGFAVGDISVTNGGAGNLINTLANQTWTADITPAGDGTVEVGVAGAVAQDGAGNDNTAAATLSRTYDGTAPGVVITSDASAITNNSPFEITISFDEPVVGFTEPDITVSNGAAGNLVNTVANQTWTADITPAGDGTVEVKVFAAVAIDGAGNDNSGSATLTRTYNGTNPSVDLTSAAGEPTNSDPFSVTITFSKEVSGFTLGDITVTNGTATDLGNATPSVEWTVNINPDADGMVDVDIDAGVAEDGDSNLNTAASTLSRTYDGTPPVFTSVDDAGGDNKYDSGETITFDLDLGETGLTVTADLSVLNASFSSTQALVDDGDSTYSYTTADVDTDSSMQKGKYIAITFNALDDAGNSTDDSRLLISLGSSSSLMAIPLGSGRIIFMPIH